MIRALCMIAGLLLVAPGCATAYTVGALSYPWGEIAPATSSAWVVLDRAGRSREERDKFERQAPPRGVAITFVEPGVFEWEGRRYSLARTAPRSWWATGGWSCLMPVAVVADVILLPVYIGFVIALLAS